MPTMNNKTALVAHYRWLRQVGDNDSHSGNGSVRVADQFWITPAGACADRLTVDDLVLCAVNGAPTAGASLDANLHAAVYRLNPQAGAVLHSHGPNAIALTLNAPVFEPQDFEGRAYFPCVPVLPIEYDRYLEQAPQSVADALRSHRVVIVRGHGLYAADRDLNLAYKWLSALEHSAKIAAIARQSGLC